MKKSFAIQNLHTHSIYDDGKDTPEEMVKKAIEQGFSSIGFSGHSYMPTSPKFSMSLARTEEYKKEIQKLKQTYQDEIDIFCGLEVELYSKADMVGYDYLIGSAHYFKIDGEYISFDRDVDGVKNIIDIYFDGNGMHYVRAYYELISSLPRYGKFDIVGHFDLIAKHIETHSFFDENSPTYLEYAYEAIEALRGKIPFFEINTGAIARGYRTTPYPSILILKRLLERGFLPIISSDCHDKNKLACGFESSIELLKSCGAKTRYILTREGFQGVCL